MNKTDTNSILRDGGDDSTNLQQPEIELISLYKKLSQTPKGNDDYKQILQEIEGTTERIEAHRQLFCALTDEVDRERLCEIVESVLIVEKRIRAQMKELLGKDLTITEMLRLSRLINSNGTKRGWVAQSAQRLNLNNR